MKTTPELDALTAQYLQLAQERAALERDRRDRPSLPREDIEQLFPSQDWEQYRAMVIARGRRIRELDEQMCDLSARVVKLVDSDPKELIHYTIRINNNNA